MTTITVSVTAGADDGHWTSAPSFSATATSVLMGDSSSSDNARHGFARFLNLTIPQGSTINFASISVTQFGTSGTIPTITIYGNNVDSAVSPTNGSGANALALTSQTATWTPTSWTSGQTGTTPSLTSIVQAIVNRSGWASGNAMLFAFKVPEDAFTSANAISFRSFDNTGGFAPPSLTIDYTAPSTGTPSPNAGADQGPVDSMIPVTLSAAASTNSPTTFQWRVISGGGVLGSPTASTTTYKPPATVSGGSAVIGLRVGNGSLTAEEDTITVTYRPHTEWALGASGATPILIRGL